MKLKLYEITAAIQAIEEGEIMSLNIRSYEIVLGSHRSFNLPKDRLIEFKLGYKTSYILKIYGKNLEVHEAHEIAFHAPSIYAVSIKALHRAEFPISLVLLNRDYSRKYRENSTVAAAWKEVYRNVDKYWVIDCSLDFGICALNY